MMLPKLNPWINFKSFLDYFLLLTVSSIILFFFYLRWVKHNLVLGFTQDNGKYFIFMFASCFIILIIYSLQILLKKPRNNIIEQPLSNKNILNFINIVAKLKKKINIFYHAYNKIFTLYGSANPYSIFVLKTVTRILSLKKKTIFSIIIIFVILPRTLIMLLFLYELKLGQLQYYYYYSFLLLFPLFFRILIFILEDIGPRLLPEVLDMVDYHYFPERNFMILKPEYSDIDPEIFYYVFYRPLAAIEMFMLQIKPIYLNISLYTNWFYFLIHVLGLSYVLYVIYI